MTIARILTSAILAVCAIGGDAPQQPVFRGTGEVVRVFVTVTDRDGRLVTTLTQPDFEVRDDGKPQPIAVFDNSPRPIRLIVMLDVSGSMDGNLPLLRAAADELITRLQPRDAARLGTFGLTCLMPGLRVSPKRAAGVTPRFASGRTLLPVSLPWLTSCTASTCSVSHRQNATARRTRSMFALLQVE